MTRPEEFSFDGSFVKEWLNTRFLQALPITWQTILATTKIPTTRYNLSSKANSIQYIDTKVWLPGAYELNFDNNYITSAYPAVYNEGIPKAIYSSSSTRK